MMSENKDYLGSLAQEISKKPDSFKEEKVERIQKSGPNFNPKIIIGAIAALIVVLVGVYFIFLAPKISMPNFVGKPSTDVASWAKTNDISNTNIIMNKEFSMEFEENVIISQTIQEGKKIKKDTKLVFSLSQGADPSEKIAFPDIKTMSLEELNQWKDKYKLNKTKIEVVFDEKIAKDEVISYELKNVAENNFTRGDNLSIKVSKGPQPAGQVTVEDFTNKPYPEMETWAKTKKVTLEKTEVYSDTVAVGSIVSQSAKATDTVKQGDVIQVSVSKGPAVKIPDFSTYDKAMFEAWVGIKTNTLNTISKEIYYVDDNDNGKVGYIIKQSLKAGSLVDAGSVLEIVYSLGKPFLTSADIATAEALRTWAKTANSKGANINLQIEEVFGSEAKGTIIDIQVNGDKLNMDKKMPLSSNIKVKVSKGTQFVLGSDLKLYQGSTEDEAKSACEKLNCYFEYADGSNEPKGTVISASQNGSEINVGDYINDSDLITIRIKKQ